MEYLGAVGPVVNFPNVDKGITTLAINKSADRVSCVKEKRKLLKNFHVSKKGKTADKVSCGKNIHNLRRRLLTM